MLNLLYKYKEFDFYYEQVFELFLLIIYNVKKIHN